MALRLTFMTPRTTGKEITARLRTVPLSGRPMTPAEIGHAARLSPFTVRRIEARALRKVNLALRRLDPVSHRTLSCPNTTN